VKHILVLNGPNLNMLGKREVTVYGSKSLADINDELSSLYPSTECALSFFQSNHEGALIDELYAHFDSLDGLIINPGGFTHTSIALRDAVACLTCPKVEVHISNIHTREPFRQHSYFSDIVNCVIAGAGTEGYLLALRYLFASTKKE
jgi:3-dehydroquinate dehydratase II